MMLFGLAGRTRTEKNLHCICYFSILYSMFYCTYIYIFKDIHIYIYSIIAVHIYYICLPFAITSKMHHFESHEMLRLPFFVYKKAPSCIHGVCVVNALIKDDFVGGPKGFWNFPPDPLGKSSTLTSIFFKWLETN